MGGPFAYLRKSRLLRDQEAVSPEMQLAAVREYAGQFGDADLVVLSDMNVSGRKGRAKRPGFDGLLTAIEAGQVSVVYSYSLSRLSRNVRDILSLAELCRAHRVPIRLARDADPDPMTASGRMVLGVLAVIAQFEADVASERALDTVATRRARGDHLGGKFFDREDEVIEAYREAGTVTGAARLLHERGVLTRNGNDVWYPSSVRVVLDRTAPHMLPRVRRSGWKHTAPFTYFRLLRCHCGTTMTGVRSMRRGRVYTAYLCNRGRYTHHHRAYISERVIAEWAEAEVARLRPPTDEVTIAQNTEAEQAALRDRLERAKRLYLDGDMDRPTFETEKRETTDALMQLDLRGRAVRVPRFDWNHEPVDLNRALRVLWEYVELDRDLHPVRAQWTVPDSWLAPADTGSPPVPQQ